MYSCMYVGIGVTTEVLIQLVTLSRGSVVEQTMID